jgi:hemolysin activation/secretion protein
VLPILKAGPVPGTVDMELKVSDKLPLHVNFRLDNAYTAETKPLRASAGVSYTNLFAALDAVSVQYQDAPQAAGQVSVVIASYTSRPFSGGYRLSGYFVNSNSDVANIGAGTTGVLGKGQIAGLRWIAPPYTTEHSFQTLSLGIDYKHFKDIITAGGNSVSLVTPITYSNASISYSGALHLEHFDGSLNITPNFGVRGAPNSADAFENKRFLGRPNYFYLRWDGTLQRGLPAGQQLMLRLAGQLTTEPLISNENFSIGGSDGVRGYYEAEELGDTAYKATLQWQSRSWDWKKRSLVNAFSFFDVGYSHAYAALPGQTDHVRLSSWGIGLNLLPASPLTASVTWADPLSRGSYTPAHQSRVLFVVKGSY